MSTRLFRRAAAGILIAASLILAIGALSRFAPFQLGDNAGNAEVESGEMLLHGQPRRDFDVSYSMPLSAIASAYLFGHAGLEAGRWLWAVSAATLCGLTFALGLLLGGWASGAAALALMLPYAHLSGQYPINTLYAIAVLLVAGLLVRRARAPTPVNTALLGLALGLSLLQRTPLVFFPLALAMYEMISVRGAKLRGLLPVFIIPILFLLPWIAMNWRLYGEFVPLEHSRIEGLLLNAVYSTRHISGASQALADGTRPGLGGSLWAMALAAGHDPRAYLASVLSRIGFIAMPHPALFLAAAAGLLFGRRREELRTLGLLVVYFTLIHSAIAISEAYLVPLWPLLAALAAGAIPDLRGRAPQAEPRVLSAASNAFIVFLVPAAIAGLLALGAVIVYPRRLQSSSMSSGAHHEAWLLLEDGRLNLAGGEIDAARKFFSRAAALRPDDTRLAFYLAWTQALQGHPETLLRLDPARFEHSLIHDRGLRFLKAAVYLERGQRAAARVEITAGLASLEPLLRPQSDLPANAPVRAAPRTRISLLEMLSEFLRPMSARDRERLLRAVVIVAAPDLIGDVWLNLAQLADARGDRARALADAEAMERSYKTGSFLNSNDIQRVTILYRKLMNRGRAAVLLDELIRRSPANADLRLEQAELAMEMGKRSEALESLARVEALHPAAEQQQRRVLRLYRELKELRRATAFLEALTQRRPRDVDLWSQRAELALETGEPNAAREALVRARDLKPDAGEILRIMVVYGGLKDYRQAFELSKTLVTRSSEDPGSWILRAEFAEEIGKRSEALESLSRAEALAPSGGQIRRVAALHWKFKNYRRAAALVDELIRRYPSDADLRVERAELWMDTAEPEAARRGLARAADMKPNDAVLLRMAVVYGRLGDFRRAFELSRGLVEVFSPDPEVWILRAEAAMEIGKREAAFESLSRAESLPAGDASRDDEKRRRIALAYQRLKDYGRALKIFSRLSREHPLVASYFSDKALCEYLQGSGGAELVDLRTAMSLEPKFLPAYLTLGAIYIAKGQISDALNTYDEALSKTSAKDADPLRETVLAARNRLVSNGATAPRP